MREEVVVHDMNYRLIGRNGDLIWINCRGKVQMDLDGRAFVMIGRVSEMALASKVDALTGLFNKKMLFEKLDRAFASGLDGYLVMFGVDELKSINIKRGRDYGNNMLKKVAKVIEDSVQNSRNIFRVDGDCFAICLPEAKQDEIEDIYALVQKNIESWCTVSAGAVSFGNLSVKDAALMYQYAENTLDKAKKDGKNTLSFFSSEDYEKELSLMILVQVIPALVICKD